MPSAGPAGQGAYSNPSDVLQEPLAELDGFDQAGHMMSATSTPINHSNNTVQPPNTGRRMTRSDTRYVSNLVYHNLIYSDLI